MEKVTAGRDALGDFAPKFAELNDDVLFGQVWSREDKLSPRDRSVVTVTALMASGVLDSSLEYLMCQKERRYKRGNGRNFDSRRFLCRLAKGLGSFQNGKKDLRIIIKNRLGAKMQ